MVQWREALAHEPHGLSATPGIHEVAKENSYPILVLYTPQDTLNTQAQEHMGTKTKSQKGLERGFRD